MLCGVPPRAECVGDDTRASGLVLDNDDCVPAASHSRAAPVIMGRGRRDAGSFGVYVGGGSGRVVRGGASVWMEGDTADARI
jgi:hypothetical protein